MIKNLFRASALSVLRAPVDENMNAGGATTNVPGYGTNTPDPNANTPLEGAVKTIPDDKGGMVQHGQDASGDKLHEVGLIKDTMTRKVIEYKAERHPLYAAIFAKAAQFGWKGHKEADYPEIGEIRLEARTSDAVGGTSPQKHTVLLPLHANDNYIFRKNFTAFVWGQHGYDAQNNPAKDMLMLYVTAGGGETAPSVIALNGPRMSSDNSQTYVPEIPAGTLVTLGAAALAEEEVEVDPINVIPGTGKAYLQKKAYSVAITDFFNEAVKDAEFDWGESYVRRQALVAYKKTYTTTALFGSKQKWYKRNHNGVRNCYTQAGIINQLRMGYQLANGKLTKDDLIGIAKMLFTSYTDATTIDVFCGSNFIEALLNIDLGEKVAVIQYMKDNELNIDVATFKCTFGTLRFYHETGMTEHHLADCAIALPMDECLRIFRDNGSTKSVDGNKGETGHVEELKKDFFLQDDCFIVQSMASMFIAPASAFEAGMASGIEMTFESVDKIPASGAQKGDKIYLTQNDGEYTRGTYEYDGTRWLPYTNKLVA